MTCALSKSRSALGEDQREKRRESVGETSATNRTESTVLMLIVNFSMNLEPGSAQGGRVACRRSLVFPVRLHSRIPQLSFARLSKSFDTDFAKRASEISRITQ